VAQRAPDLHPRIVPSLVVAERVAIIKVESLSVKYLVDSVLLLYFLRNSGIF
jgi:hypothetical protein